MKNVLNIANLSGNQIKQGDKSVFVVQLLNNEANDKVDGLEAVITLARGDKVVYETISVVADGGVKFVIDKVLPIGEYELEVVVGGRYKFPSDRKAIINVVKSHEQLVVDELEEIGIDEVIGKIQKEASGLSEADVARIVEQETTSKLSELSNSVQNIKINTLTANEITSLINQNKMTTEQVVTLIKENASNLSEDDVVGLIKQHVDMASVNDRLTTLENKPEPTVDDTRVQALEEKVNSLQASGGGGGLTQKDVDDILTETFFGENGDGTDFEVEKNPSDRVTIPTRGWALIRDVMDKALEDYGWLDEYGIPLETFTKDDIERLIIGDDGTGLINGQSTKVRDMIYAIVYSILEAQRLL